jgi:hypothetical protein
MRDSCGGGGLEIATCGTGKINGDAEMSVNLFSLEEKPMESFAYLAWPGASQIVKN